jgi:predicted lipid-binding transport protein (Tim44 family)
MAATTTPRRRAQIRPGGIFSGLLCGLALLVLFQQFSVLYPTAVMTIIFLVGGLVLGLVLPWLAGSMRGRGSPAAPMATGPAIVDAPPPTPPPVADAVATGATAAAGPWAATHTVPAGGLDAYANPTDGTTSERLDAGLEVQVVERIDTRAKVVFSNGWTWWVEGTTLQPVDA